MRRFSFALNAFILFFFMPRFAHAYGNAQDKIQSSKPNLSPTIDTSFSGEVTRFGNCINRARLTKAYRTFRNACELCHDSSQVPKAGIVEQCRQMSQNWCLENQCPSECSQVEKKCESQKPLKQVPGNDPGRQVSGGDPQAQKPTSQSQNPKPSSQSKDGENGQQQDEQAQSKSSGNQNADIQSCDQVARQANLCCKNPASCITTSVVQQGPAPGQGLTEYCQQLKSTGAIGGQTNNSASGICYQAYNKCVTTCEGMANGYTDQVAQIMRDLATQCRGYQSRVSELASQGLNSQVSGSGGDICNQLSQAQPQNFGGATPSSENGSSPTPGSALSDLNSANDNSNCETNPQSQACRALAYEKDSKGEASFSADAQTVKTSKDFDIQDPLKDSESSSLNSNPEGFKPQAAKNGTIANNSGGSIPGGNGTSPASLGGGGTGRGAGSPGSPGYTTDVLQGFNGAGGYTPSSSIDANADSGAGGFGGYGRDGRSPAADQNGVDLRRFLPGGDRDPLRRQVGGLNIYSAQINGKFVNIWNRISDRIQEKCRLGELIGCE